jgi:NADH-quinone oxidoreductase subunit N
VACLISAPSQDLPAWLASLVAWLNPSPSQELPALMASPVLADPLAHFTRVLALGGGLILVLFGWNEVPDRLAGEYHGCLLIIVAGLSLTGSANELITLFLALEMISIPTYVLLYLPRRDPAAEEAALKYFMLSVFSSGLLLFGFSYLYGLGGTTNMPALAQALSSGGPGHLPGVTLVVLVMVLAGLGFKITAVPFHFYAPDVYQGAPTAVVALLAFIPKVAGFVALVRVLGFVPAADLLKDPHNPVIPGMVFGPQVATLLWILAAVTMTLGNVLALLQNNLKRLLAYSSVAHAGYMLIGLAVAPYLRSDVPSPLPGGVEAVLFYLVAYGAMTVGAFAVIAYLSTPEQSVETVDDLAGLSRTRPGIALAMALFLFSLIGIPLTAGFAGKLWLFMGALAINPDLVIDPAIGRLFAILALIGALNAAIGAWYYLRICAVMYLRGPVKAPAGKGTWPGLAVLSLCAFLTLGLGIRPGLLWLSVKKTVPQITTGKTTQGWLNWKG